MRALAVIAALLLGACQGNSRQDGALRLGMFPNVTHAQGLVGHTEGTFRQALGPVPLEVKLFNAGPPAMEALLAGEIDVAYVGAGPAILAYLRSEGRVRVIAGAASGGAVFVTRGITDPAQLRGKRIATPQIGNTQDIALRHWLKEQKLLTNDFGGDVHVQVTPLGNPEILNLFRNGKLDGAWVPEPWASRLVTEGKGTILLDERELWPEGKFPTTVLVATGAALKNRRAEVRAILEAHRQLTERANANPEEFLAATQRAFFKLTAKQLPDEVMKQAFSRITFTTEPMREALQTTAAHAKAIGYLEEANLSGLVDDSLLQP